MATVHPSRMGLVPPDTSRRDSDRGNRRSRSRSPIRDRSRSPDGRGRRRDHSPDSRRRSRSRSREPKRRASPAYDNYERPAPAPWREERNMYPPREGGHKAWNGGGGADYMESRRQQRLASTLSIWPPSPPRPKADDSHDKKSKKSKRKKYSSDDSSDSSDDDRSRRRREKDRDSKRKRHHKDKDREKEKSRSHRHKDKDRKRSSRRDKHDSDTDDSDRESRRRHREKSRSRSVDMRIKDLDLDAKSKRSEEPQEADEDMWVEKAPAAPFVPVVASIQHEELEDDEIGPMPVVASGGKLSERDYGGALLRGEGSAMAAYIQDGERIPRRGEIGLTSDEIETYETVGYVMSGSRHRRMNAVRMRKENQVISAEEKRGILKMQREEREKRESMIIGGFKEILEDKLKMTGRQ
ncbi:unnamed protein product [Rhizoctonia solani]|uniref:NF-kappa-B-activating protein C-terminal domain-containing protein n=1 Tax=Rhizoctonia solani TaxID=456999 RepID=A0A8H3BVW0_9AGAM|nr:unnamed protein product [Rhizoctonia solani]